MERRHLIFFLLAATLYMGWMTWFAPKQPAARKAAARKEGDQKAEEKKAVAAKDAKAPPADKAAGKDQPTEVQPAVEPPLREDIVLGNPDDEKFNVYAQLSNRGGVVTRLQLSKYKTEDFKGPLVLLREETPGVFSFGLKLGDEDLRTRRWEVVESTPQRVVFRIRALGGKLQLEKRYTLEPDTNAVGLTVAAKNLTKETLNEVAYTLDGGNGLPIEGAWYTRYFRNLTCLMIPGDRAFPKLDEVEATRIASEAKEIGRAHV